MGARKKICNTHKHYFYFSAQLVGSGTTGRIMFHAHTNTPNKQLIAVTNRVDVCAFTENRVTTTAAALWSAVRRFERGGLWPSAANSGYRFEWCNDDGGGGDCDLLTGETRLRRRRR